MNYAKYKSNGNFVISEVAGETVIVPMTGSVAKMGKLIILNSTSSFIVKYVAEPHTVAEIAKALSTEYEVPDEGVLMADIQEFIDHMVERGLFSEVTEE
ncbi:MAG: PqqD family protein [Bacteroidales bacterium]|nr:PqqD family protein [Bacteroidales bacterium]